MVRAWLKRIAANVLVVAMLAIAAPMGAQAEGAADIDAPQSASRAALWPGGSTPGQPQSLSGRRRLSSACSARSIPIRFET